MILVAIEDIPSLFELEVPKDVQVVSSATLSISRILKGLRDGEQTSNHTP
jgi:hypothetical protein